MNSKVFYSNILAFVGYIVMLAVVVLRLFVAPLPLHTYLPYILIASVAAIFIARLLMLTKSVSWRERRINGLFAFSIIMFCATIYLFFLPRQVWVPTLVIAIIIDLYAQLRLEQYLKTK